MGDLTLRFTSDLFRRVPLERLDIFVTKWPEVSRVEVHGGKLNPLKERYNIFVAVDPLTLARMLGDSRHHDVSRECILIQNLGCD